MPLAATILIGIAAGVFFYVLGVAMTKLALEHIGGEWL